MTHTDLIARLRLKGPQAHEQPNHHVRRMEVERIEAADALTAAQDENERLRGVLQECESALDLHGKMYPAMVKGYTLDALNSARTALDATGKGEG